MAGKLDANSAAENVESYDAMVFISVDSASEIKQKKWDLKNTIRGC
jgi:hypothetical protein